MKEELKQLIIDYLYDYGVVPDYIKEDEVRSAIEGAEREYKKSK